MSTVMLCPQCGEEVYEAQFERHLMKDHIDEVEESPRSREELISTLIHEYGLGIDTIAVLTGGE